MSCSFLLRFMIKQRAFQGPRVDKNHGPRMILAHTLMCVLQHERSVKNDITNTDELQPHRKNLPLSALYLL